MNHDDNGLRRLRAEVASYKGELHKLITELEAHGHKDLRAAPATG